MLAEELGALGPCRRRRARQPRLRGRPHKEVRQIICDVGVTLIDGEAIEVRGVGFAGAKGFGGGFGRGTLSAFGEPAIKAFVKDPRVAFAVGTVERGRRRLSGG